MNDNQEIKVGLTDGDDSKELQPACIRPFDGWISVNYMAPKKDDCVDVWLDYSDSEGRICNCFHDAESKEYWYWDEKVEARVRFNEVLVTHWRSIPEAPVK